MPLFRATVLLILMSGWCHSQCGKGCSRCQGTTCAACDFTHNFQLRDGSCVLETLPGCAVAGPLAGCLECEAGEFLTTEGACAGVPSSATVPNCAAYDAALACRSCAAGFFVSPAGRCEPLRVLITDCEEYSSDGVVCARCAQDRKVSSDGTRCLVRTGFPAACLVPRALECARCADGFLYSPAEYLSPLKVGSTEAASVALALKRGQKSSRAATLAKPLCSAGKVSGCVEYAENGDCLQCPTGSFLALEAKACLQNPAEPVEKCEIYETVRSCRVCAAGYFRSAAGGCSAVQSIPNCAIYDGSASATVCLFCVNGYYLSGGACQARDTSRAIANCVTPSNTSDSCETCSTGYARTSDGFSCLTIVSNCEIHAPSSQGDTGLRCSKCSRGFALREGACIAGRVTNCATFVSGDPLVCSDCEQGFFLSENACLAQSTLEGCAEYSTSHRGLCTRCQPKNALFSRDAECRRVSAPLANCDVHASASTCLRCRSGFYVGENGTCSEIPADKFCRRLAGGANSSCLECVNGKVLHSGVCRPLPATWSANCVSRVADSNQCLLCAASTSPYSQRDLALCREQSELWTPVIAGCQVYAEGRGCRRCAAGQYVSVDGQSCIASCDNAILLADFTTSLDSTDLAHFFVQGFGVCTAAGVGGQGCRAAGLRSRGTGVACVECVANRLPSRIGGFSLVEAGSFSGSLNSEAAIVECLAKKVNDEYYPGEAAPDSKCANWGMSGVSESVMVCRGCAWGVSGVSRIGSSGLAVGSSFLYAQCGSAVGGCEVGKKLSGLGFFSANTRRFNFDPATLATCHVCTGGLRPVVWFDPSQTDGLPSQGKSLTECRAPTAEGLGVSSEQFEAAEFVRNCAMIGIQTNQPASFSGGQVTMHCLACPPGYRRVLGSDKRSILRCLPIENCATPGNAFNICGTCASGFAWSFDSETRSPRLDVCEASLDSNCAITSSADITRLPGLDAHPSKNCFVCLRGFSFDADGRCAALRSPFCSAGEFSALPEVALGIEASELEVPAFVALSLLAGRGGCAKCDANRVAVVSTFSEPVCLTDPSISSAPETIFGSAYVLNCARYSTNSGRFALECGECAEGFIPVVGRRQCAPASTFPACEEVEAGRCVKCKKGYYASEGICLAGTALNCREFGAGGDCEVCEPGFVVSVGGACEAGMITGCLLYTHEGVCTQCEEGFKLVGIAGGKKYCLALPTLHRCSVFTGCLSNNDLTCVECPAGFYPDYEAARSAPSVCLALNELEGCEEFAVGPTMSQSSLQCTKCNLDTFFLRDGRCESRRVVAECAKYDPTADGCAECRSGRYLSPDRKTCPPNPAGVLGCSTYVSLLECGECLPGFYLSAGACLRPTAVVSGCRTYKSATTCLACEHGYFLDSETLCSRASALNCLTVSSPTACATCEKGFGLVRGDLPSIINCLPLALFNCLEAEGLPLVCSRCESGFYPLNGGCAAVTAYLPGCVTYRSPSLCSECSAGLVLSISGAACLRPESAGVSLDSNCLSASLSSAPGCAVCQAGYFPLADGSCSQCNTSNANCLVCDPLTPQSCLLCNSGFDMVREGVCTARTPNITTITVGSPILGLLLVALISLLAV